MLLLAVTPFCYDTSNWGTVSDVVYTLISLGGFYVLIRTLIQQTRATKLSAKAIDSQVMLSREQLKINRLTLEAFERNAIPEITVTNVETSNDYGSVTIKFSKSECFDLVIEFESPSKGLRIFEKSPIKAQALAAGNVIPIEYSTEEHVSGDLLLQINISYTTYFGKRYQQSCAVDLAKNLAIIQPPITIAIQ